MELKNFKNNPPPLVMIPYLNVLKRRNQLKILKIMTTVFKMAGKIRPKALQRIIELSVVPYIIYSLAILIRFVF